MDASDTLQSSFEALAEMALAINSIREPERVLEQVLTIAMEALEAERGFILLQSDSHPDGFEIESWRNFTRDQLGDVQRLSKSVVYKVLQTGEPVVLYEALKDDGYGGTESIIIQQIQSIACVPLRLKEQQIGAIYLDSLHKRGRFTREALPFLTAFANQAAVAIENARLYQAMRDENRRLRHEIQRIHGFGEIIGQSPRMREVFDLMARVTDSDASVLILGESGTGKELVARAIHYNGPRKDQPFVAVFCGSLPDELLESELFGHKKGAFTGATSDKKGLFEVADGGTVFLDEVGDLSPRMQTVLLRVLQEGEIKRVGDHVTRKVDVRVISATNKSLKEMIEAGEFREDLYYRLDTITIELPPLRQRRGDVALLAHHFLDRYAVKSRSHIRGFEPEAMQALQAYAWPGNVRELEKTIERAVVLARGDLITRADLRLPETNALHPMEHGLTLKEMERRFVLQALEDHGGNISETARSLDVSRRWLHYKLKEWETATS
ncbi:MAG: GAF domain-containing protein [Bacteroidetes bacterium]|nr:sigma-54-dependent Fis family transcriptional regulator [Rhodothermaceae bacterium RA]RMH66758.1 MAG: GAF domain-containing protein [Bacteroidota bacterium]